MPPLQFLQGLERVFLNLGSDGEQIWEVEPGEVFGYLGVGVGGSGGERMRHRALKREM